MTAKITAATVKGSVFSTDEFASDNDLSRYGKRVPIDHGVEFADGEAHIDGIEGSWSYAKRLHRLCHGVDRENFPVYLAEYEFRYNHRDDHLLTILFDRLYRPQIEKGRLPWKIPAPFLIRHAYTKMGVLRNTGNCQKPGDFQGHLPRGYCTLG